MDRQIFTFVGNPRQSGDAMLLIKDVAEEMSYHKEFQQLGTRRENVAAILVDLIVKGDVRIGRDGDDYFIVTDAARIVPPTTKKAVRKAPAKRPLRRPTR